MKFLYFSLSLDEYIKKNETHKKKSQQNDIKLFDVGFSGRLLREGFIAKKKNKKTRAMRYLFKAFFLPPPITRNQNIEKVSY